MRQATKAASVPWCGGSGQSDWDDVPTAYATWADVEAQVATWADLAAADTSGRHWSFEDMCGPQADWSGQTGGDIAIVDTPAEAPFAGARTLAYTVTAASTAYVGVTTVPIPVTEGTQFRYSAWVRGDIASNPPGTKVALQINWFDSGGGLIEPRPTADTSDGGVWRRPTVTATAPVGAVTAVFRAFLGDQLAAGDRLWLDEAEFFEVNA